MILSPGESVKQNRELSYIVRRIPLLHTGRHQPGAYKTEPPSAEGKCNEPTTKSGNEVLQRRSKHFYSVVLYSISFFIKVRCFRCTGRKKPQKIPVLCGFLSLTHCNEPATNLQRSGRFCLELSSCKGQLSCFSVIFSKLHVRCREFVALRFTDSPSPGENLRRCAPAGLPKHPDR